MDSLCIQGGVPLEGRVAVSGAKNAALPVLAAALLSDEPLVLENLPEVADIRVLLSLLQNLGVETDPGPQGSHRCRLQARSLSSHRADYDLVRKMRASVLVLGPLLARLGRAEVSLPGGCAIGARPVDLHVGALRALGAEVELEGGYLRARIQGSASRLAGGEVVLPSPSVGASENALMAASLARGETRIVNAASEPEVADLARCLSAMGAEIEGAGSSTILVQGRERLGPARHRILPDRIEAGTYAAAAAVTGGRLVLEDCRGEDMEVFLAALKAAGAGVSLLPEGAIEVDARGAELAAVNIATAPHPGFPTDLQAQFMALMTQAKGESLVTETIFENRFMHVQELRRLGARIAVRGRSAVVEGPVSLKGAPVMATDLRASVSLVLAGLVAEGETLIGRVYHLDRGYEGLEGKLSACGARIKRLGG